MRTRLNEVFGPGFWRTVALRDPVREGNEIIWYRQLETRDGFKADAVGHAKYQASNPNASYGDALETCKSDALTRCCKDMGVGLQVWNREYQIYWVNHHAMQVPMLSGRGMQWRRKGRPALPGERLSERQTGPDYERKPDYDDQAKSHLASMSPSMTKPTAEKELRMVSRDEYYQPEADPDFMRRLHEQEDAVFHDDGRE